LSKRSHLTLHLFNKRRGVGGGRSGTSPAVEKMDQEHMKMNGTMMNEGGGYKQKVHDMIVNKRNEGKKWS